MADTPIWPIEGVALDSAGDEVAGSLGVRVKAIQTTQTSDSSDITAIKAVTDVIPDAGAMTGIETATDKIDGAATDGLEGTSDSLSYRTHEIERHLHSYERWFETAATPDGEVHVADRIGSGGGAFQIDAGNDTWGAWLQILGSSDTPADAGMAQYDPHKIVVEATERNETYFVQVAYGASGAAAFSAGTYTETVLHPLSNQVDSSPIIVQCRRQAVGTKAWARCMCPGQDTATLDFYLGIHEYEG